MLAFCLLDRFFLLIAMMWCVVILAEGRMFNAHVVKNTHKRFQKIGHGAIIPVRLSF